MPKARLISRIAILILCAVFFVGCDDGGKEIKGTYPSSDSYFRQNITGTGVCDLPGPKAYLHVRFAIGGEVYLLEQTPSVSNGSVFASGEGQYGKLPVLIAFDEYSGSVLWRCETDSDHGNENVTNSPFPTSKAVFIGDDVGDVYCVDKSTGKIAWEKKPSGGEVRSTAIVYGGKVYVGGKDFYCMDEETGGLLWSYKVPEYDVEGSPAYCDGLVFFGERRGILHALDAETGKEVWTLGTAGILTDSSLDGPIYSSPAVADNIVCVGIGRKLFAIDAGTGQEKWTFGPVAYTIGCSPAIWQNKVYMIAQEKKDKWKCYCLDLAKGGVIWAYDIDGEMAIFQSPVISEGVVYFGDNDGTFYALDAKTGDVVFKEKVADKITSSVAIHDHAAFFGNMDKLYCVEDYRFNPRVIEIACAYQEYKAKPPVPEDAEALAFVEKEKWHEKPEYFLLILDSARDQFVEPSIRALERLTGEKFTGDFKDIKTAREQAYKQYTAWYEKNKSTMKWNEQEHKWETSPSQP